MPDEIDVVSRDMENLDFSFLVSSHQMQEPFVSRDRVVQEVLVFEIGSRYLRETTEKEFVPRNLFGRFRALRT